MKTTKKVNSNFVFLVWRKHFVRDLYADKALHAKISFNCETNAKAGFQIFSFYLECMGKSFFCDTSVGNNIEGLPCTLFFNQKTKIGFFFTSNVKTNISPKKKTTLTVENWINKTERNSIFCVMWEVKSYVWKAVKFDLVGLHNLKTKNGTVRGSPSHRVFGSCPF